MVLPEKNKKEGKNRQLFLKFFDYSHFFMFLRAGKVF
jgi:hypothetical protein